VLLNKANLYNNLDSTNNLSLNEVISKLYLTNNYLKKLIKAKNNDNYYIL